MEKPAKGKGVVMKRIVVDGYNITSALGTDAAANFNMLLEGSSGVRLQNELKVDDQEAWVSLAVNFQADSSIEEYSRYEQLLISSVKEAAQL